MLSHSSMSREATLQLKHDGKSNVLRIGRGVVTGSSVVVDFCQHLPRNQDDTSLDCVNRGVVSRIAQSTDFVCSYSNCSYHHNSETRYILHVRSHFDFEVTPDAVYDTEFKWAKGGKYTCSKCPRATTDLISFREHIRHHIIEKPYKCSLCMIAVTSIPELRIHFQYCHFGKQADFVFNGSVHELNTLLSILLPQASPVKEPLNITFKVPEGTKTRICCTSALGETHSVGVISNLLADNNRRTKQQELHQFDSEVEDDSPDVKQMPGKYEFKNGIYKCVTCFYSTQKYTLFTRHVWKHIHGSEITCAHNSKTTASHVRYKCAIVTGLVEVLRSVQLSCVDDSLRKNSVCDTESDAHSRASESLEDSCSFLSAKSSKYYISSSYEYRIVSENAA